MNFYHHTFLETIQFSDAEETTKTFKVSNKFFQTSFPTHNQTIK